MLFIMSLSGSVAFLLYGLMCLTLGRYMTLKCRYFVLKLSLFFFLFPFPLFKYHILYFITKIISLPENELNQILDTTRIIVINRKNTYVGARIQLLWFCILFMAAVFLFMMIVSLIHHNKTRSLLLSCGRETAPSWLKTQFDKLKKEWDIPANVELVCSRGCETPVTIGIFKPKILFPSAWKENLGDTSCEFMLRHELLHVRQHDLAVELLGLLVIALHWYNPLSYLLYHELAVMREFCCDEKVIGSGEEGLRKEYSHLLIDAAAQQLGKEKRLTVHFLGHNRKVLERRILEMKEKRKPKAYLAVLVSVVTFLAGSVTSFAYVRPQTISSSEDTFDAEGEHFFVEGTMKAEPVLYETFWVNADGSIEEVTENDLEERVICKHIFKDGTYNQHKKNSSGGCTVICREAKKCTLCGYVEMGEIISSTTYKICPH